MSEVDLMRDLLNKLGNGDGTAQKIITEEDQYSFLKGLVLNETELEEGPIGAAVDAIHGASAAWNRAKASHYGSKMGRLTFKNIQRQLVSSLNEFISARGTSARKVNNEGGWYEYINRWLELKYPRLFKEEKAAIEKLLKNPQVFHSDEVTDAASGKERQEPTMEAIGDENDDTPRLMMIDKKKFFLELTRIFLDFNQKVKSGIISKPQDKEHPVDDTSATPKTALPTSTPAEPAKVTSDQLAKVIGKLDDEDKKGLLDDLFQNNTKFFLQKLGQVQARQS